jgi:ribosomal subunit interface protein
MKMDIHVQRVEISEALHAHTTSRPHCALGRFGRRVLQTTLHLTNVNGPRRAGDLQCRLTVTVSRLGRVSAEVIDPDLYTVIDRAVDRVEHFIAREPEHRRVHPLRTPAVSRMPASAVFRRLERART